MDKYWQAIVENKYIPVLVLLIICLISFIPNLGVFDPSLMEARNFVTAREMVQDGNWLFPTMNGEPRLAKPPLPTWLTAITILLFGSSENVFALRLPAAFAGIMMVLSLYFFVWIKTKNKEYAFISGIISATSLLILQMARTGSWDIHCHAWMMAAISCWVYALSPEKVKVKWLYVSAIFMGLSFLSKGPVSFYTILLPFVIASIAIKEYGIKKLNLIQGIIFLILVVIISSWWPAYIYFNKAEIGMEVMKQETTAWAERHIKPIYFYFHFPIYIGLWAIPVIASFFYRYARTKFESLSQYNFLIAWMIGSLFLLSIIPEKKERYLLPLIIPIALLASGVMFNFIKSKVENKLSKNDKLVLTMHSIAVVIFNFFTIAFIYKYGVESKSISGLNFVIISLMFVSISIYLLFSRFLPRKVLTLTVVIQLLICIFVFPFFPAFAYPNTNFQSLSTLKSNEKIKNLDLYAIGDINLKHVYAIGRKVKIIKPNVENIFPDKFPAVVLSGSALETILPDTWLEKIIIEPVEIINASRKDTEDVWHINIVDLKNE